MDQKFTDSLKELNFAELPKEQEERLRDLEKQFNNEFGKDYYFMVMRRSK